MCALAKGVGCRKGRGMIGRIGTGTFSYTLYITCRSLSLCHARPFRLNARDDRFEGTEERYVLNHRETPIPSRPLHPPQFRFHLHHSRKL